MVHLDKENFIGKAALAKQQKQGVPRQFVGLEIDWPEVEARYEKFGLTPAAPSQASRVAVPVYLGGKQVGKATTTTWSPVLKKMIALASVDTAHSQLGTKLQMEITIEAMRQQVTAKVVKMPFFNPERKDGDAGLVCGTAVRRASPMGTGGTAELLGLTGSETRSHMVIFALASCLPGKSRRRSAPAAPTIPRL